MDKIISPVISDLIKSFPQSNRSTSESIKSYREFNNSDLSLALLICILTIVPFPHFTTLPAPFQRNYDLLVSELCQGRSASWPSWQHSVLDWGKRVSFVSYYYLSNVLIVECTHRHFCLFLIYRKRPIKIIEVILVLFVNYHNFKHRFRLHVKFLLIL